MKKCVLPLFLLYWLTSCSQHIVKAFLAPGEAEQRQVVRTDKYVPCKDFMNYAPDSSHPEYTPMRYIRVRFFIVRHDPNDHQFDLEKGKLYIDDLMNEANDRLRNNQKMNLPPGNNTPVLPINYQYILYPDPNDPGDIGIKVIYDTALAYVNKKAFATNNGLYDHRLYNKYGIQKDSVLNIFMMEHYPDSIKSKTYQSSQDGVGFPQFLKLVGAYQWAPQLKTENDGTRHYPSTNGLSALMNHELGHTLGLLHSWSHDDCADTPDNPNCWDQNSPRCKDLGTYSNNMMDYNNSQQALTPCQIAKVQYNMARDKTSQRKLLLRTWCDYKKDSTVYVNDKVVWSGSHDLEGDIVIENHGSLTIQCRVSLPKGARITVKQKGTLIIDGGEVTNLCNDNWEGIEVWKNKRSAGKVILINSPSLSHMKHSIQ